MASVADTHAASNRVAYALIALRNSDNLTPRIIRTGRDSYGVDEHASDEVVVRDEVNVTRDSRGYARRR